MMLSHFMLGLILLASQQTSRLVFETNRDQALADVRYLLQTDRYQLDFKHGEVVFHFGVNSLRIRFAGQPNKVTPAGKARLDHLVRFVYSDDAHNKPGTPTFASVRYESLYNGIDLSCHGHAGQLECDFAALPGADPEQIQISLEGADRVTIDEGGNLVLGIGGQTLQIHKPEAFQVAHGRRNVVDARYDLKGTSEIGLKIGQYNRSIPLIIDTH
jgi:hypothetical protein